MSLKSNVFSELETIVGSDFISDAQHVRWTYSRDVGIFPGHLPDVVIKPQTTPEIQSILRFANTGKIPVYVRGAGACYAGGVVPVAGGILIDLTRMDKLLTVDKNSDITLGLTAVLPTGEIIETGSTGVNPNAKGHFARYGGMPDLTGLFIGSDGSLGVITDIALRIVPLPESTVYRAFEFKDYQAAERTFVRGKRKGLHLVSVNLSTSFENTPRLYVIIEADEKIAQIEAEIFDELAKAENGINLDPNVAQKAFEDNLMPGEQFSQGSRSMNAGFVPLVGIGDYLDWLKQLCLQITEKHGYPTDFSAFNVMNSWDATIKFFFNESDPKDVENARKVNEELQARLFESGALSTKRGQLWNKYVNQSKFFELFKTIKHCLDPNNIMSPGVHGFNR